MMTRVREHRTRALYRTEIEWIENRSGSLIERNKSTRTARPSQWMVRLAPRLLQVFAITRQKHSRYSLYIFAECEHV